MVALNIKDPQTEKLVAEVVALTGESKAKAVRVALQERRDRLRVVARDRAADFVRFLEEEVWPQVPRHVLGKRISRGKRERILGYGEHGV